MFQATIDVQGVKYNGPDRKTIAGAVKAAVKMVGPAHTNHHARVDMHEDGQWLLTAFGDNVVNDLVAETLSMVRRNRHRY